MRRRARVARGAGRDGRDGGAAITDGREEEGSGGRTRGEGSMPVARTTTAPDLPSIHPGERSTPRSVRPRAASRCRRGSKGTADTRTGGPRGTRKKRAIYSEGTREFRPSYPSLSILNAPRRRQYGMLSDPARIQCCSPPAWSVDFSFRGTFARIESALEFSGRIGAELSEVRKLGER